MTPQTRGRPLEQLLAGLEPSSAGGSLVRSPIQSGRQFFSQHPSNRLLERLAAGANVLQERRIDEGLVVAAAGLVNSGLEPVLKVEHLVVESNREIRVLPGAGFRTAPRFPLPTRSWVR